MDKKTKKPLTMKQENFCREYLLCGNASEAYRRAYNCENMKDEKIWNNAYKLLNQNNDVKARITELKENLEELLGITKATEIKELIRIRSRCLQPEPVMEYDPITKKMVQKEDTEGNLVWQFDSAGANSATDKIFKALGYYKPEKQEITGKDGKPIQTQSTISQLDNEKLKSLDPEKLLALKKAADIQNEILKNA